MRVIIAGSRTFNDYYLLKKCCDVYLKDCSDIKIVCGMAKGADLLGLKYAKENNYEVMKFPALWNDFSVDRCVIKTSRNGGKYNALAGHNRNEEMAKNADMLICFWDGTSTGTKNMISLGEKYNLIVKVKIY